MVEIRISGRGGQGAVLASQILAAALFENGLQVQSFPSFGAERRGAPVSAFLRADPEEITLRCGILHADWIVLFEADLLDNPVIMAGATPSTSVVLNMPRPPEKFDRSRFQRIFFVDASGIAERLRLRTTSFSIVNTAMVGAFACASGLVDMGSIARAVQALVPVKREENARAAEEACEQVREMVA
ncbi:MAG: 2-oxoacid:acceptor oxidoreductase family protein [Deltaproteobacteria bacterium]|nr:2-oxoacid:acceptor oxidoreductase family protein [Deltaproteobacteria bacterium]